MFAGQTSGYVNSLLLNMAIEIVDFPIKNGGSFHSCVSLPEGQTSKASMFNGIFAPATLPSLGPRHHVQALQLFGELERQQLPRNVPLKWMIWEIFGFYSGLMGFIVIYWDIHGIYPLVMTNSSPWYRWPIEMDGLPFLEVGIFHGYVTNNQMVYFMGLVRRI